MTFKKWPRKRNLPNVGPFHDIILSFYFICNGRNVNLCKPSIPLLSQRCNLSACVISFSLFFSEINSNEFSSSQHSLASWNVAGFGWERKRDFWVIGKNYEKREECNFMRLKEEWEPKGLGIRFWEKNQWNDFGETHSQLAEVFPFFLICSMIIMMRSQSKLKSEGQCSKCVF